MANTQYDIGDKPVFTASFYNTSDVLTDPSTVVFLWRTPGGTETSYQYGTASEVTKASTGVYTFTPPTIATTGPHSCRAKGTVGLIAAAEMQVGVRATKFQTP